MATSRLSQSWNNNTYSVPAPPIGNATITATTGSPTIDSSTRSGKTIYKFTGSGSITVGTAGYVECLVIGGGGGGCQQGGGGGAGGLYYKTSLFLPIGANTITVGGAGTAGTYQGNIIYNGNTSSIGTVFYAPGGGGGGIAVGGYAMCMGGNPGGSGGGGGGGAGSTGTNSNGGAGGAGCILLYY